MKTIRKRVPAHTTVSYQCEICGKRYRTKEQALACESRKREKIKFKVGDRVRKVAYKHECQNRSYTVNGIVIKIYGPLIPYVDHWNSYLWSLNERYPHAYRYEIEYLCPVCNLTKKTAAYAEEIEKIKPKTGK